MFVEKRFIENASETVQQPDMLTSKDKWENELVNMNNKP